MTEINLAKSNPQQSLPHLKQLPILEIVQNLHNYNVRVAKICRQHSLNLLQDYQHNKTQYKQVKESKINEKIKTVSQFEEDKKKTLETKQREMKKKNNENIAKLEHILEQKRIQLEKKEAKMMQESQIRRLQFLKSLRNSHYVSQDKRYHIKQRESKEMQKSILLQKEKNDKVQAALERRGNFLNELKQELKRKNEESGTVIQNCREQQELRKSYLLKKIVEKELSTHRSLEEKVYQAQKKHQQKKKENQKKQDKHLKKRGQILEEKYNQLQKQKQKVEAKISKANATRQASLKSIANNKQSKRQLREKQQFYASIYRAKENQDKLTELSQKLYSSHQSFYNARQLKQKLHIRNLYDHCKLSQQLWRHKK